MTTVLVNVEVLKYFTVLIENCILQLWFKTVI